MTRINVSIHPAELPNKLLLAEIREIKRIPNMVKSGKANTDDIPKRFSLNKGHVRWFYNKNGYTLRRYRELRLEALKRGFNVQDFSDAWNGLPQHLMGDFSPTPEDRQLLIERITERGFKLLEL